MERRAHRLANALLGLGLAKGDRVALLAYNCIEWMEMYAALAKAGLVGVPINFRLVGPRSGISPSTATPARSSCRTSSSIAWEALRGELDIAANAWIHIGKSAPPGWTDYEALIAAATDAEPAVEVSPADTWLLMYTSGTTGKPKGAIRTIRAAR